MFTEGLSDSELELMCQNICFGLGKNQYEELGLEVSPWSDVTTTYEDQNFKIVQRNPCDGGYFLDVYYKGKKVLSSETREVFEEIPIFLRRKEDIMHVFGIGEKEVDAMRRMDFSEIRGWTDYQHIQIDESNPVWIDELCKTHEKFWPVIDRKLTWNVIFERYIEVPPRLPLFE